MRTGRPRKPIDELTASALRKRIQQDKKAPDPVTKHLLTIQREERLHAERIARRPPDTFFRPPPPSAVPGTITQNQASTVGMRTTNYARSPTLTIHEHTEHAKPLKSLPEKVKAPPEKVKNTVAEKIHNNRMEHHMPHPSTTEIDGVETQNGAPIDNGDPHQIPPQDRIRFVVAFDRQEIETLRAAGFLTQDPTPKTCHDALWDLIDAAFAAGLTAKEHAQ
jgi:hypothetical protein